MSTNDSIEEARNQTSTDRRTWSGMIRRMAITLSSVWQVTGHILLDSKTKETREPDMFAGLGFYARPAPNANAEAIVAFVGGSENPVIIAARDEDARKAIADIAEDETAAFNRATIIIIKANGTVEIRSGSGAALVQPTLLGNTYRGAEDALFSSLNDVVAKLALAVSTLSAAGPILTNSPAIPAFTAAVAAVATAASAFVTAASSFTSAGSTYLTTVLRAQ